METIKLAITGSAGQIGYSLLFRIAAGDMFGKEYSLDLRLLEVEAAIPALKGVLMELQDCAFPLLEKITITSNTDEAFRDVDWALLVGAAPRKAGMERSDLLKINGGIFQAQGKSLGAVAGKNVKILVVGNPCNTNAYIAMKNAKSIPRDRWFAMTRLDANRARHQLAEKAGVHVTKVTNMTIWGNHSTTQYPDFLNSLIDGKPVMDVIQDHNWLENDFIKIVQNRGGEVIKARGASSAASAANAIIGTVRSIIKPTGWFNAAVPSDGSYGVEEDLVSGFPLRSDGNKVEIVKGIKLSHFFEEKFRVTLEELKKEKEAIKEFID